MQKSRWFLKIVVIVFLFLLSGALTGAGAAAPAEKPETGEAWAAKIGLDWGPKYWPAKPVRGGILNWASSMYVGLMNPNHWPINDWTPIGYCYEKLIQTDATYKPTIPWLAESWKYLDDLTLVMKLRQGVQFHDGTPFTAEGLKYQMEWIMDPQNGAWTRSYMEPVKSIEVIDTYTLKWHFKRPDAAFLGVLATAPGYVISPKALKADVALKDIKKLARNVAKEKKRLDQAEKEAASAAGDAAAKAKTKADQIRKKLAALEEDYQKAAALAEGASELDSHPVGTGWYIFEEASPGNYVKVKRNPNWWLAKFVNRPDMPYFDGAKVHVIPDPSVRLASLRAGKLGAIAVDPAQYPQIKNDRKLQVYVYPINRLIGLNINQRQGPCQDIRIRKAIAHAIDRKALIAGVAFGLGRPASCVFPDDHWAHNPNLKPVSFDPVLSRKLLAEAGYKNGLTLNGYMLNTGFYPTLAEALKAMLAKVGINWKVDLLDSAALADKWRICDYDLAGGGWEYVYDPDLTATGMYHPDGGFNFGRSRNEKAISLIEAGRREMNEAKRTKIYYDLEEVLYNNYEDIYLWYPNGATCYLQFIQGYNYKMYLKLRDTQFWSHPLWFKNGKPQ